jgi:type II secretory ATPase GspE/PulE/Tfp pilus assembly ATPase PilB-like protein
VTRLLDLGIEPYLVSSSAIGVMAQRLVRRVCSHCARPCTPSELELQQLGLDRDRIDPSGMLKGAGCGECRKTGYRGRIGLFELLIVDEAVRRHVQNHDTAADIKTAAIQSGMARKTTSVCVGGTREEMLVDGRAAWSLS